MALPAAPMGQLGNMSMPYSIPTYEKGPGVLEKALAAFLVNAAGNVASQGAQNVMSRDYAKDFGEDPAKGFGRLLGPKVGAEDAAMRRKQAYGTSEREAGQTFIADQADLDRLNRQGEVDAKAANDRLARDDAMTADMDMQALRDLNAMIRGDRDIAAMNTRNDADNAAAAARQEAEWTARRNMPSEQMNQVIIDRMRGQGQGGGQAGAGAPNVNPNVAAFAQGDGTAQPPPSPNGYDLPQEPDFVIGREDIARLLSEGRTPEEIMQIVQRQQAVSQRAQAMPMSSQSAPPLVNPEVEALMRILGLSGEFAPEMPVSDVRQLR